MYHPRPMSKSDPSALGDVLEFMQLLWSVNHGLEATSKRMETTLGVTGPQRLVLRVVGRFPGISAGALAETLRMHPSTLTGVLRRIERRGLVTRKADPADGRRALFTLTAAGRVLDKTRRGTVEAAVTRALARLPVTRIRAARDVLQGLAGALEDGLA